MTNPNKLTARIAASSTAQIEAALKNLDARGAMVGPAERMVSAALADELTARWGINAELDRVFMDDAFTGSYYEAMVAAKALKAARA